MTGRSKTLDESNGMQNISEEASQASSVVSLHKRAASKDQLKNIPK